MALALDDLPTVGEPFRLVAPDGTVVGPAEVLAEVLGRGPELLAGMIAARVANRRMFSLQRQGRTGTFAPIEGEEASVVGAVAAFEPATDWVVPYYRELLGLGRYGPEVLYRYALYQRGHPGGGHLPEGVRVLFPQISLAAQLPHAVGLAWGRQLRGASGVVLAFCGDGASSEGDFAESLNLAGVRRAPVVFWLKNNGWAISTPLAAQTAAPSWAGRGPAYGMPGVRVDGNDALAVAAVAAAARAHAAAGRGPVLVEAVTYRMGPHTTADDPLRYVPAEERARWAAADPIGRLRAVLGAAGRWDDTQEADAEAAGERAVDAAWIRAEATPVAPDAFFDHVYAEPTPRQRHQREELRRHLAARETR
jgi:pyruvate dehydrogenase E1 component alpha subunit